MSELYYRLKAMVESGYYQGLKEVEGEDYIDISERGDSIEDDEDIEKSEPKEDCEK